MELGALSGKSIACSSQGIEQAYGSVTQGLYLLIQGQKHASYAGDKHNHAHCHLAYTACLLFLLAQSVALPAFIVCAMGLCFSSHCQA